jgi:hypothetical protein
MAEPDRLSESQRNKLLRRVDWRFLLRIDRLPTTVSFAGRRLTRALELVSASVSCAGEDVERADLAVLVSPRARSLRAGYDALRPGGEVYAEWYLPTIGVTGARRRLEAAGFVNVRCYLCWPWPQRAPKFWLPLDAPEAVASFVASRPRVGRRNALLRTAWRAAVRLRLMIPLCTIAQKPGATPHEVPAAEGAPPNDVSWVLLTGGIRSVNKVVGLGFADSETQPRLAVKFARSVTEDNPLEREAATLRMLRDTGTDVTGVPEVLFVGRRSGRIALGETAVPGQPLLHRLDYESFATTAAQVTSWLVELAQTADVQPRSGWSERLVEGPVREFERMFASVLDTEETARGRQILSTLTDLSLVCEHRDCSPWNVLHDDGGGLAVVDWESSEPKGLPALDLVYFLTCAALLVEQTMGTSGAAETYARTLDPRARLGAVVQACEQSYCERIGLGPDQLRPLRLLCWIVHSRSDYRQLEQDALGPPAPDVLAGSLFLSLWRHELSRSRGLALSSGRNA